MNNKKSLLEQIYERNPENGNYIIEISLVNYVDIFNDWDHAPLRRKDIDPDLLHFLEDSIDDIPRKNGIDVCFYLSDQVRNEEREQRIISWFRTFYRFYVELERKKIHDIFTKAIVCLFVSLLFFISSYLGEQIVNNSLLLKILSEIVVVGGWVFLWEAISSLTFDRAKIKHLIKNYNRFAQAAISFRYKSK